MGKRSGCARNNDSKPGSRPVPAVKPSFDEPAGGVPVRALTQMSSDADRVVSYPPAPRLPRWLIYAGVGAALGAAVLAYAVAVGKPVPELLREARQRVSWSQYKPGGFVPPTIKVPTPTPVVSQYKKKALEEIAMIGQKEPTLAHMLAGEVWVKSDSLLQAYGLKKLAYVKEAVVNGNYTLDSLVSGVNETTVVTLSEDEFRRATITQIVKESTLLIGQFLGVNYPRPLLVINTDSNSSGSSSGWINFQVNDWTLRNKTHETGHQVYEIDGAYTAPWFSEGVAELAGIYAASMLPETSPELVAKLRSPDWKGREQVPNFDEWYKGSVRIIDTMESRGVTATAPMTKGFVFLYEFRELVGQKAFAEAMGHLYDVKAVRVSADRNSKLTDKDIEAVLEQHVPQNKLPTFKQLYQSRVYDLPTMQP